jgi:hypothetical protein
MAHNCDHLRRTIFFHQVDNINRLKGFDQRRFIKLARKNVLLATIAYSQMEKRSLAYVLKPVKIVGFVLVNNVHVERVRIRSFLNS